ncbi:hypothetical protein AB434_2834 [Heyndrickxia coagulans]|nr:hypothetical protein AB434_2834 [Heyndrickxia coagulans]KYC89737.1 hypothetical protein B4096_3679 [Heyndrickxia coagulans]
MRFRTHSIMQFCIMLFFSAWKRSGESKKENRRVYTGRH